MPARIPIPTPTPSVLQPSNNPVNERPVSKYQNRGEEKKFEQPPLSQQRPSQQQQQPQLNVYQKPNEMDINQKVAAHMERIRVLKEAQYQAQLQAKSNISKDKAVINIPNQREMERKAQQQQQQNLKPKVNEQPFPKNNNNVIPKQIENRKVSEKNERIRPPPMKPAIPKQEI